MTDHSVIIEKIKKLWTKAQDDGVTEAEAATFTEKVHDLLARHNLDLSMIAEPEKEECVEEVGWDLGTGGKPWQGQVAAAAAKLCLCACFRGSRWNDEKKKTTVVLFFIGTKANVEVTKALVGYLYKALARVRIEEQHRQGITKSQGGWIHAFNAGCGARLSNRMYQLIRDREAAKVTTLTQAETTALVVVADQELKRARETMYAAHPNLRTRSIRTSRADAAGYAAGYSAGDRISLHSQISHG